MLTGRTVAARNTATSTTIEMTSGDMALLDEESTGAARRRTHVTCATLPA